LAFKTFEASVPHRRHMSSSPIKVNQRSCCLMWCVFWTSRGFRKSEPCSHTQHLRRRYLFRSHGESSFNMILGSMTIYFTWRIFWNLRPKGCGSKFSAGQIKGLLTRSCSCFLRTNVATVTA